MRSFFIKTKMKTIRDNSYGIIPVFKKDKEYSFLAVLHKTGHWAFPKGHLIGNETPLDAAKRELYEETDVTDCIIPEGVSFEENYNFEQDGCKINKTVAYFLGFVDNQETHTPGKFKPEILESKWVSYSEALRLLTHDGTKDLLKKVNIYLETLK